MKKFIVLAILFALSSCAKLPENATVEETPKSLTIQTGKYTYTGTLTIENGTTIWQLTEPEEIAGVTLTCTDTDCTIAVGEVTIPLDDRTAEHVRGMLENEN